jgi:hypothetical protein
MSQNDLILAELTTHRGEWVSLPRLVEVGHSFNVSRRITDLREAGHAIFNKIEQDATDRHKKNSYYRLT